MQVDSFRKFHYAAVFILAFEIKLTSNTTKPGALICDLWFVLAAF